MLDSVVPFIAIGFVTWTITFLVRRFPPSPHGMSRFDRPDLIRRNRPLKIGIMVAFFFPMLVLGYLLWSGAVPQHDVRAAAFFIALAFLIPPLALAVIGVRSGFQRVREFARYVELSDRISVTVLLAILMPVWLVSLVFCAWGAASFL